MNTRRLSLSVATLVVAASILGCGILKKKQADAGEEEGPPPDAATVTVSGTGAKNEATVLRYANETALPNEPAVIGGAGIAARNFPGNGPQVAFLAPGTAVTKIAQYFSTGVLVLFDDPSGGGDKLMGWISPKGFDVAAVPPPTTVKTVVPPRLDAGPAPVVVKDAGTAIVDAGSTAKDAGTSTPDAGAAGGLPQPKRGIVSVPPVDGKCPTNWAVTEGMCRRKCGSDKECEDLGLRNTKCKTKSATKVCTSD